VVAYCHVAPDELHIALLSLTRKIEDAFIVETIGIAIAFAAIACEQKRHWRSR